jgi:hypothetical protein
MQHLEYSELTRHVMSFGGNWTERPASKHIFTMVNLQQIRKIRVPAWKLLDSDAPLRTVDLPAQPTLQCHELQFFAGTYWSGVGM